MAFLTLDQIKTADDIKQNIVEIPEWGGDVKIKCMSGRLRNNLEQKVASNAPHGDIKMLVITSCCLGEDGNPLFTPADKKWLVEKASSPIETLFVEICKISGMGKEAFEEAEGN